MWRLGEALGAMEGENEFVLERRKNWVAELRRLPEPRQDMALDLLTQLALPPRQRCQDAIFATRSALQGAPAPYSAAAGDS